MASHHSHHAYHQHTEPQEHFPLDFKPLGVRLHGGAKLHRLGYTGKGVRVGVLDSGADENHELWHGMLKKQIWYRHGEDLADSPHGTHVGGTVHLMAPGAEIYDYRVFGTSGVHGVNKGIAHAIVQAYLDGCQVLNLSLGTDQPDQDILAACKYVTQKGVILVCAAGNGGDDNPMTNEFCYPSPYPETLSIAAVAKKNGLPHAYFSNTNPQVDYAGLGWLVQSLKAGTRSETHEMSGTSMACPHICGMICCLLSETSPHRNEVLQHKSIKALETMKSILTKEYCIDIGSPGFDNDTGLGFLTYLTLDEFNMKFRDEGISLRDASAYKFGRNAPSSTPRETTSTRRTSTRRTNTRRRTTRRRTTRRRTRGNSAGTKSIEILEDDNGPTGFSIEYLFD